jgi:tetratricopeptide (TPR) repeat protein
MENLKINIFDSISSSNNSNVSLFHGKNSEVFPYIKYLNELFSSEKCYVYNSSVACLPTESFFVAKQLVYQQFNKLDQDSELLTKYKKPLCYLMPWLKDENDLYKNVTLGLDVPEEQNPTSFTLSFVYQVINGIINFLLESAKILSEKEKVAFVFSDIDQTDFSSMRFIEQLAKRANQGGFYLIGIYSAESLPEKYTSLSRLESKSIKEVRFRNAAEMMVSNSEGFEINAIKSQGYSQKDLASRFAELLDSQEINKKTAESFKEAAIFSKKNACYEETIYYVDILIDKYWGFFDNNIKAKLLRLKGVSHVLLKQNKIALECLEESIKLSSDRYFNSKVCYIIGSFITKHIDEALGQKWLDRGFSYIEGLDDKQAVMERLWLNNSRALYYFKNNEYDRAIQIEMDNIKEFNLAFDKNEHVLTHAILNYNTAYALQDRGNLVEALSYIDKAIQLVPSHLDLYNNKANILQMMGRYEESVYYYEMVKEEGLPKDEVYVNCGNAKVSLGKWEEALDDYNYSLFINPGNYNAWNLRGYLHYLKENYYEAISDFTESLKINPRFIPALLNRALAYEGIGQSDNALMDYYIIEETNKRTLELYVNRSALYQKSGKLKEAIRDLKVAIELWPNQAEPYVNLAIVYNEQGNFIDAKNMLEKAVKLEENNPWIYFNKAYIHKVLKEYQEAKEDIEKALLLDPHEIEFSTFLQEVNEILKHQVSS